MGNGNSGLTFVFWISSSHFYVIVSSCNFIQIIYIFKLPKSPFWIIHNTNLFKQEHHDLSSKCSMRFFVCHLTMKKETSFYQPVHNFKEGDSVLHKFIWCSKWCHLRNNFLKEYFIFITDFEVVNKLGNWQDFHCLADVNICHATGLGLGNCILNVSVWTFCH